MSAATASPSAIDATIWDKIGDRFNGFIEGSIGFVSRLFGSANERAVKATGYHRPKGAAQHTIV
ncbi:MAG TPA: hypothetical protein VFG68_06395, partial [Fimbriiglobus sp.]|nr:hypothetical protein [Fimbriiglobus sp.]